MVSAKIQVSIVVGNRLLTVDGQTATGLKHGIDGTIGVACAPCIRSILRRHMDQGAIVNGGAAGHIHQVVMGPGGGAATDQFHLVGSPSPQSPVTAHRKRTDGVAWSDGTAVDGYVSHRSATTEGTAIDLDVGVVERTVDQQGAIGNGGIAAVMVCAGQDGCATTTLMNATRTAALSRISRQRQSVGLVEIDNTHTTPIIRTDFNSIGSK